MASVLPARSRTRSRSWTQGPPSRQLGKVSVLFLAFLTYGLTYFRARGKSVGQPPLPAPSFSDPPQSLLPQLWGGALLPALNPEHPKGTGPSLRLKPW